MFYNTYSTYITYITYFIYETYRTYPALCHISSTDYLTDTDLFHIIIPPPAFAGDPLYLPITHKKTAA